MNWKGWNSKEVPLLQFVKKFFLPFSPFFFFYLLFLPFIILFSSSSRHSVGGDEQESEKFFPAKKKIECAKNGMQKSILFVLPYP